MSAPAQVGTRRASERAALAALSFEENTPFVKQLPVVTLFVLSLVMTVVLDFAEVTNASALVGAIALMASVTAFAAVLPRLDPTGRLVLLVPALDFLIAGVFRFATGEGQSIFASLAILPVIWVASSMRRLAPLAAFCGVSVTFLVPFALGARTENLHAELGRSVFAASAFAIAAAVVHGLARLARNHISSLRQREQRAVAELEGASAVQRALLPKSGAGAAGYEFAGVCLPATTIGGDFFDWYDAGRDTAFTLGDVMGKGVGAGIIAATVRAVVRSARNHTDLSVALDRASETLSSDLAETASFATMFHGRLNGSTGIVSYIDAGHGLTLHVHADGSWERITSHDMPVGIASDTPWTVARLRMLPGDVLISCSDGILDLYDGTVDSLRHIAYIVSLSAGASNVVTRISALIEDAETREDDIALLVLSRPA
ncbi:PP2C family protein-serine/threonine phosphatase [Rathayibacter sp. SD072]|uniref:PP2C family protein-serine/threonine phosphatase n=1 Tax=Rathayibacter sp. SD072 TaxID=2781731 RepID=UPI001A9776CE|nr:SpoIIE family protein phosphatase [Rathayibacter sp. SD072]MBO0984650.1 SpoIIE family protein phosphatase [Rathayibacter sp. SD072]